MAAAWASAQDVIDATGVSATEQQLVQAQKAVEVFSNRIYPDAERMRTRDLYWLGQAVAYQAAWLAGQFGLEARLDATQIQQDGVSTTLQGDGLTLAPMAARALRRVSWMRSRTVHIRSAIEGAGPVGNVLSDAADESLPWTPTRGCGVRAVANTRVSVLGGTTTDTWGDEVDGTTVLASRIPAALAEKSRTVTTPEQPTPRVIRYTVARLPAATQVDVENRIKDEVTGTVYAITDVYRPGVGHVQDLRLDLKRVT